MQSLHELHTRARLARRDGAGRGPHPGGTPVRRAGDRGPCSDGAQPCSDGDRDLPCRLASEPRYSESDFLSLVTSTYILCHLDYDFLIGFDAATLKPRPDVARTRLVRLADGKVWTFRDARGRSSSQDGTPFTARDCLHVPVHGRGAAAGRRRLHQGRRVLRAGRGDTTVVIHTQAPRRRACSRHGRAHPTGAHLVQGRAPEATGTAFAPATVFRHQTLQSSSSNPQVLAPEGDAVYGVTPLGSTSYRVGGVPDPVGMVSDLQPGRRRPVGFRRRPQFRRSERPGDRKETAASPGHGPGPTASSCSDSPTCKGDPALRDPGFARRSRVRHRPREDRRGGLRRLRRARVEPRGAVCPLRVPLGTDGRRGLHLRSRPRPGNCSTRPATRTLTATDAVRRSKAGRSPCASWPRRAEPSDQTAAG